MGESETLFKLVLVLGVSFLLIGAINPGSDAAYQAFSSSVQNFPSFQNPFDERFEVDLRIIADGTIAPASTFDTDAVANCDNSTNPGAGTDWFGCVSTPDGGVSTASTTVAENNFKVNLSAAGGVPAVYPVLGVRTITQCNALATVMVDYLFYKSDDVTLIAEIPTDPIRCAAFVNITTYSYFDPAYPTVGNFSNGVARFNTGSSGSGANFSYLRVTLIYGATEECSGTDTLTYIGCVISGFFNFLIRLGRLIVNAFVFIGQTIVWFGSVAVGFLVMFGTLLTIPGAPTLVQGIISAIVVGLLVFIALVIFKAIRGSGSMG